MTKVNIIPAQIVPAHPDFIKELNPDLYYELDDYSVILKENVRVILASRLPDEQDIVEKWSYIKEKKNEENNA